jgi:hypothetical protein
MFYKDNFSYRVPAAKFNSLPFMCSIFIWVALFRKYFDDHLPAPVLPAIGVNASAITP